jgi:putative ABC transport system permease protein
MISIVWLRGVLRRRPGQMLATGVGVGVAVALLASIGMFLGASKATMTERATSRVAVDWQVQASTTAKVPAVAGAVAATRGVAATATVWFAATTGLDATTGTTSQATGPGVVVGLPDGYASRFPAVIRPLVGSRSGVLLAQQTAANLRAGPGDSVTVGRDGLPGVTVRVNGVVDLPEADSFFQAAGTAASTRQAPPDNVVLLPAAYWHMVFDPLAAARPAFTHAQVHVRLSHSLPTDPAAAYTTVTRLAANLESRLAGGGRVGDNLAAALDGARGDALYAQVLFVFLGLPGAVIAALLTATLAGAAGDHRRRQQALLRTRGASRAVLVRLAAGEALAVALLGAVFGLGAAGLVGRSVFGTWSFGATATTSVAWSAAAACGGLAIAALAVAVPAWRDARTLTVAAARRPTARPRVAASVGWSAAVLLAAGAATVYWLTSRTGYQLVVAPEGVPSVTVNYWALAGPLLLWLAAGVITWRVTEVVVRRARRAIHHAVVPLAGPMAATIAAAVGRRSQLLARAAALVALTVAFAASTAVFNATYRQQARVDAFLTNGADITVDGGNAGLPRDVVDHVAATPGVRQVEPIHHTFAYVGNDLQDLYGVDPVTVASATQLQDAYFSGGSARTLMGRLRQEPDSVIVSSETVRDYQLQPGDTLTLRLQDRRSHRYVPVMFHYAGIVHEFPTAPTDSFLVANAAYVARATGDSAPTTLLVGTGGHRTGDVAGAVRTVVGTAGRVSDLSTSRRVVGSSLTAVDLTGLSKVELGFAVVLAAAATGLVLWLGLAEQRRTFAIAATLGATARQLSAFVWAEVTLVTLAGLVLGAITADVLAHMLVRVLTGVFDPPPATLAVPWGYLTTVAVVAMASVAVAAVAAVGSARRASLEWIRTS